jgi:hypothetical protein
LPVCFPGIIRDIFGRVLWAASPLWRFILEYVVGERKA